MVSGTTSPGFSIGSPEGDDRQPNALAHEPIDRRLARAREGVGASSPLRNAASSVGFAAPAMPERRRRRASARAVLHQLGVERGEAIEQRLRAPRRARRPPWPARRRARRPRDRSARRTRRRASRRRARTSAAGRRARDARAATDAAAAGLADSAGGCVCRPARRADDDRRSPCAIRRTRRARRLRRSRSSPAGGAAPCGSSARSSDRCRRTRP